MPKNITLLILIFIISSCSAQKNLKDFFKETKSIVAKKILDNFKKELKNFTQVCPIEMLDKLKHPINFKPEKKRVS